MENYNRRLAKRESKVHVEIVVVVHVEVHITLLNVCFNPIASIVSHRISARESSPKRSNSLYARKVKALCIAGYVSVECLVSLDYSCQWTKVVELFGVCVSVII